MSVGLWVLVGVWAYVGTLVGGHWLQRRLDGHPPRSWQARLQYAILWTLVALTRWMHPFLRRMNPEGWREADENKFIADLHDAHAKELREHARAQRRRAKKLEKERQRLAR